MTSLSLKSRIQLNDGRAIPALGFGVYKSSNASQSTRWALAAGFRQIDTANGYESERDVENVVRQSGIPREDIWITSKIHPKRIGKETASAVDDSLKEFDGDQIDLMLLHSPTNGKEARIEGWRALVDAQKQGKLRSIGVSNFSAQHIDELLAADLPAPAINQVEQRDIKEYCDKHRIVIQAYCPIIRGAHDDPTLVEVAKETGKTVAQVLIRWSMQSHYVPIPKSDTESRIKENVDVFDFELDAAQMAKLTALDRGADGSISWNPVHVD